MNHPSSSGFTIVELLIVIVVIGILATIVLNSFSNTQERSAAVTMVDGIKKTEKAFRAFASEQGATSWWIDGTLTGVDNPTLVSLVANTSLKNYIREFPEPALAGSGISWTYDNDGDSYNGCSVASTGVNIAISGITNARVAAEADRVMDDNNISCGRLRYDPTQFRLRYNLSPDQSTGL